MTCVNCGTADPGHRDGWRQGYCWPCFMYQYRTGRERPGVPCYRGIPCTPTCVNCGRVKAEAGGEHGRECNRCRVWRWRKGVAWPAGAIYRVAS